MILIVDSGSTKSDWILLEDQKMTRQFSTMGFNPYFHNESVIRKAILGHPNLSHIAGEITEVYYYGAGCSTPDMVAIVKAALKSVFVNAKINVDHDLTASAYATYDGRPAIACILGTGSNACYFDGESVTQVVPSLAYILGDEGSGSYYGKKVLAAYLYKQLPDHLQQAFVEEYDLSIL